MPGNSEACWGPSSLTFASLTLSIPAPAPRPAHRARRQQAIGGQSSFRKNDPLASAVPISGYPAGGFTGQWLGICMLSPLLRSLLRVTVAVGVGLKASKHHTLPFFKNSEKRSIRCRSRTLTDVGFAAPRATPPPERHRERDKVTLGEILDSLPSFLPLTASPAPRPVPRGGLQERDYGVNARALTPHNASVHGV